MKLAILGALAVLAVAPAVASADHRHYDRGDRYYRGGYDRGYRYDRGSRSSFDISVGFGNRGYRDYSYVNFGYSNHYPRYYSRPIYVERPVYVAPPAYYCPPAVVYRPTYYAPRVYYGGDSCYSYGGYARPRAYYYSTGSYYYCR